MTEAPFDLEVVDQLTGLSSGGKRNETNEALFTLSIIPEIAVIPPTPEPTNGGTANISNEISNDTSNSTDTTTLSVRGESGSDGEAQGLDELESAFETESVVEGQ
jgi:hypothetical protein